MTNIKREERDKGKREAQEELNQKAIEAGFASVDAMFAHASKPAATTAEPVTPATTTTPNEPTKPQKPETQDPKILRQWERDVKRHEQQLATANEAAKAAERKSRESQRKLDALEARTALEKIANSKGIRDVDYAVHLLTRHCEGKSQEELKSFDEAAFFDKLRESHTYLFGETVVPATTGTGTGSPPKPSPNAVSASVAAGGQVDVKKMNQAEFNAHLTARGINPHGPVD